MPSPVPTTATSPEKLAQINAKFEGVYYPKGCICPATGLSRDEAKEQLYPLFRQTYAAREQEFGAERMREIERIILLRVVDEYWMDNIDAMEDLKQGHPPARLRPDRSGRGV